jgi:hypothetical protein
MESNSTSTETAADPGAAQMNLFQRLAGIYFEPSRTFADISRKRSWLGMFIVVCLVIIAANYALQMRMDPADQARKGLAVAKPFLKKFMSAEMLAQSETAAVNQAMQPRSLWAKISPIVMTPIAIYITYLILALIFLLAFVLAGAGISFRKAFTVTLWGMGPPGMVVTLLGILFIFIKSPLDLDINPAGNVISNLGLLVNAEASPVLNSFLSSIDLFTIWTVWLLAIGFSAISESRLTVKKAATPVIVLWVIWVLLKMGFWAILG